MDAITRRPRLLVKIALPPPKLSLDFEKKKLDVKFEPLFTSIRPSEALSAVGQPTWHVMTAEDEGEEVNAWDLCHHLMHQGLGIAEAPLPEFAEPDLEQTFLTGAPLAQAFAAAQICDKVVEQNPQLPKGKDDFWFRDRDHSQLEAAREAVGRSVERVRIAHLDTGYDPEHSTRPEFLRIDLQKNFVDAEFPEDATDRSPEGLPHNPGHGTGTLSVLAGAAVDGVPLGGAAFLEVVPIRVANSVVLFSNSSIARAFDYVHQLNGDAATRVDVVTMSMGGLASQAWAEAVNALYEQGVFLVTAAGNNFGNLPTHNIAYPARFKRVVAACGIMANGKPYADLPFKLMAGNYGPDSKMTTALAGCTPNIPWARRGCKTIVDHDGSGTSAATPQIAAAAALWIQKYKTELAQYPEAWMRVEAARKALFDSARLPSPDLRAKLGHGMVQANAALSHAPVAAADLQKQPQDTASLGLLRILTGLGIAAEVTVKQRMLELEALQLTQRSQELERLLPDPETPIDQISAADRQAFLAALIAAPGASETLRSALKMHLPAQGGASAAPLAAPAPNAQDLDRLRRAMDPPISDPPVRRLRVFAFDPLTGTHLETMDLNQTTLEIAWEKDLKPGPVGEYLEIVDIDPASGCAYAPVDLNHPSLLSQDGMPPSESNPRFHQQMVYAVAMKTISHFEAALGRAAQWAPRIVRLPNKTESHFVRRLRIYPHAMREANSYYSPEKKALLLGYMQASDTDAGDNLPGGTVFCCLSHDIIAHETTHALLDGLHRYFQIPSNPDVLAFHEAFADIVALFQHFTVPEALRSQIARTRGDLGKENMLGELAQQFGMAIGHFGALRSAIGGVDENGVWQPAKPNQSDYQASTEPHDRGSVLVAAVFDAFLGIYRRRSQDLVRLASAGTGVLPEGDIPHDLVHRLADEASKAAGHVLRICIRALDYCPPVDITFGDYLRALITGDRDLVPDDRMGYRVAFVQAFRRRGIFPTGVRNLSSDTLCWESPDLELDLSPILDQMQVKWDLKADRFVAWQNSQRNRFLFHEWLKSDAVADSMTEALGFFRCRTLIVNGVEGVLSGFEVHSFRPVRRVGPDGQQRLDMLVEITQTWTPPGDRAEKYRGGCTLLIDWDEKRIRYCIRKAVGNPTQIQAEQDFRQATAANSLRSVYFQATSGGREPFAMLHHGM